MLKLFKKIKNFFVLRKLNKEFDKEVDENIELWFNPTVVKTLQMEKELQQKYINGMTLLKRTVKEKSKDYPNITQFLKDQEANSSHIIYLVGLL